MNELFNSWALPILVAGSLVDLIQCLWIFALGYKRLRKNLEDKIRADLVKELSSGLLKSDKKGKEEG